MLHWPMVFFSFFCIDIFKVLTNRITCWIEARTTAKYSAWLHVAFSGRSAAKTLPVQRCPMGSWPFQEEEQEMSQYTLIFS